MYHHDQMKNMKFINSEIKPDKEHYNPLPRGLQGQDFPKKLAEKGGPPPPFNRRKSEEEKNHRKLRFSPQKYNFWANC